MPAIQIYRVITENGYTRFWNEVRESNAAP
jgi:hypothetical protein